jgi:hypothetical protein
MSFATKILCSFSQVIKRICNCICYLQLKNSHLRLNKSIVNMQIACSHRRKLEHDLVDASYIFSSIFHCVNLLLFQETKIYVDCKQHCKLVIRKSNKIDFENNKPWNLKMAIP